MCCPTLLSRQTKKIKESSRVQIICSSAATLPHTPRLSHASMLRSIQVIPLLDPPPLQSFYICALRCNPCMLDLEKVSCSRSSTKLLSFIVFLIWCCNHASPPIDAPPQAYGVTSTWSLPSVPIWSLLGCHPLKWFCPRFWHLFPPRLLWFHAIFLSIEGNLCTSTSIVFSHILLHWSFRFGQPLCSSLVERYICRYMLGWGVEIWMLIFIKFICHSLFHVPA